MEKEFIPYEQALVLKELGFDEPCFGYYVDVEVANPFLVINRISDTQGGYFTLAPLYQQAFRWFRERYQIEPEIISDMMGYVCFIIDRNKPLKMRLNPSNIFQTYEEALEIGLLEALKLIKK